MENSNGGNKMTRQFVKRGDSKATMPERATKGSAGYDIAASEALAAIGGDDE